LLLLLLLLFVVLFANGLLSHTTSLLFAVFAVFVLPVLNSKRLLVLVLLGVFDLLSVVVVLLMSKKLNVPLPVFWPPVLGGLLLLSSTNSKSSTSAVVVGLTF